MKAVVCKAYGPPESLVLEEVEPPRPGKGQVVIGVRAVGVNFPDTLLIAGKYQVKPLIGATYPLHRAADALNDLQKRKAKGKLVLMVEER